MAQCFHPQLVRKWIEKSDGSKIRTNDFQFVPCGKCVACLSARRDSWTYRLVQEQNSSDLSLFVGLTYDDENIPIKRRGNIFYTGFNKRHCQLFLKRLRQRLVRFDENIRLSYFLISEYGSETFRPHYHALLFFRGVLPDMEKHIYKFIEDTWIYSRNLPSIQVTCEANIHYCTKYSLKDVGGSLGITPYFENGDHEICWSDVAGTYLERPFMLCSTRPYLGSSVYDKLENHMKVNGVEETTLYFNGYRQLMPRIYVKKAGFGKRKSIELSSDPRISLDKYNKLLNEYFRDNCDASEEDFRIFLDQKLKFNEKRLLDIAKRKKEKV